MNEVTDYHAESRISNAEHKLERAVTEMMETLCDLGRFSFTPSDAADKVRGVVGETLNNAMGLN
jgi:hypothetical protein